MPRSQKRSAKRRKKKAPGKPKLYEAVKYELRPFANPLTNLSVAERRAALRKIGKGAKKTFEETYPQLLAWFDEFDALYLLSFCSLYFLAEPEGIDREARDGKLDFYPNYLEILQAIALTRPRSNSPKPLMDRASELPALMNEVTNSFQLRSYDVPDDVGELEYKKRFVLFLLQSETAAIRNPSFSHQSKQYTKKIFSKITKVIETHYGIDPEKLVDALYHLVDRFELRLNLHLASLAYFRSGTHWKEVWERYREEFLMARSAAGDAASDDEGRKIWEMSGHDLDQMKAALHFHSDLFLPSVFAFTLQEFEEFYGEAKKTKKLQRVLDAWSYEFGDLAGENYEHFILGNPVLKKPIVKIDGDAYFFPLTNIIGHILPPMMEMLVRNAGPRAIEKYNKAKAKLLEDEALEHFTRRFPTAKIFRGSQWVDPSASRTYENDLLIVIDRFAIVVECKSGAVDPPARRGGELRVIDTLQNLVVDPAKQAIRLIKFLSENRGIHQFNTVRGQVNVVDNTLVDHYVPLALSQEDLGTVSGNLRMCIEAGLIDDPPEIAVPSVSIHDLEVIFTILENEVEALHYLMRRAELENQIHYLGDEGDLLGFYLDTAFNLGDAETSGEYSFNLMLKSKELDPYFVGRERGVSVTKPRLKLTKWWRDIINYVIERKIDHWTEVGLLLLNVGYEEQRGFERKFKSLSSRVKLGLTKEKYNWVSLETAPKDRSYLLAAFPYLTRDRTERNEIMRYILESMIDRDYLLGLLCIGVHASNPQYPYNAIVYTDGTRASDAIENTA